jgi:anthranilate synthase component 1
VRPQRLNVPAPLPHRADARPLAGTRRRGKTQEEDRRMEQDLLADEKERAEHIMLVDLGRNDVGRVAEIGSVEVTELMGVERYSHVMHIFSNVRGLLAPGKTAFDVFRATFPAGTVSGAPKIRAMEIIEELEPVRRGPYAGAVGYFGFSKNMDTCITIRSILIKDGKAYIQVGAGIVADSEPEKEFEETLNKAQAIFQSIRQAEEGLP